MDFSHRLEELSLLILEEFQLCFYLVPTGEIGNKTSETRVTVWKTRYEEVPMPWKERAPLLKQNEAG